MYAWLVHLFSKIFGRTAKINAGKKEDAAEDEMVMKDNLEAHHDGADE